MKKSRQRQRQTRVLEGVSATLPASQDEWLRLARVGSAPGQQDRTGAALFPEFRGPLQHVSPQRFFCPTMCGCAMAYQYTFYFSADLLARVDPLKLEWLVAQHQWNRVTLATPTRILRQCRDHAHLEDPDALFAEIWHLHGNRYGYDCGCTVSIWFDDRVSQETRIHVPVEHDVHTHRCAAHAHLLDPRDHYLTLEGRSVLFAEEVIGG